MRLLGYCATVPLLNMAHQLLSVNSTTVKGLDPTCHLVTDRAYYWFWMRCIRFIITLQYILEEADLMLIHVNCGD